MDVNNVGIWVILAPSLTTLIVAIAGLVVAFAGYVKAQTAAALGKENKETLVTVGKQFDGRLTQLMQKAEEAQRALGITEGQDKERSIQDTRLDHAALVARNVVADALVVAISDLEQQKKDAIQLKATAAALAVADLKKAAALRDSMRSEILGDTPPGPNIVAVQVAPGVEVRKLDEPEDA